MITDINAEKSADGSVLTAGQKLLLKRILVELLSGPGVSGRSIRNSERWRAATQKYPDYCVVPALELPGPATGSSWDFPGLSPDADLARCFPLPWPAQDSALFGNGG